MADTQIDELRLDISIEDKTSGESSSKKVRDLATAISRLNNAVKNFDAAKMAQTFNALTASIKPLARELKSASKGLENLASVAKTSGLNKLTKNISPLLKKEKVSTKGSLGGARQEQGGTSADVSATQTKNTSSNLTEINSKVALWQYQLEQVNAGLAKGNIDEKETLKLKSQQLALEEKINKATKKNNTLFNSLKRIALYRAIRSVLKQVTQAFFESINSIASVDDEFKQTMDGLQTSLNKVKMSIGVSLYQVLILLEPIITKIADGIANFANSLSKVSANMRGTAKYTKINTDYMKEYQKATQGALLSFDTFNTLNTNNNDMSDALESAEDALDEKNFSDTEIILKSIMEIFGQMFNNIKEIVGILTPIVAEIMPLISDLLKEIMPLAKQLMEIIIKPLLNLITAILPTLISIIRGLKPIISASIKFIGFVIENVIKAAILGINAIIAAINLVIDIVNALLWPLSKFLGLFGVGGLQLNKIQYIDMNIATFADGGMFDGAGTMYALAGEAGAEVVAQGAAGTGVLNVDQFADAMVSALVRYGAARDNGNGQVIEIDGNKLGTLIASNSGFRNEMNRRNAGLNLR